MAEKSAPTHTPVEASLDELGAADAKPVVQQIEDDLLSAGVF